MRTFTWMVFQQLFLVVALLGLPAARACLAAEGNDIVIESFKVNANGGELSLPIQVGERQTSFLLDTGTTFCVFDPKLQVDLVFTNGVTEVGTLGELPLYRCRTVFIGRERLPLNSRGCRIDLAGLRKVSDPGIWGILGMEFLRRHVIRIDFDSGTVSFLKNSDGIPGERIEMGINDGRIPTVQVELPTLGRTDFMIDTGDCEFASGSLTESTFDALVRAGKLSAFSGTTASLTIDGTKDERSGILSEQAVGEFRHSDQIFSSGPHNRLGLGYLSRFVVTFDFPKQCLILKKGKRYASHSPANRLGVDIVLNDGIPEFCEVESAGLAFGLGIRTNDRLLSIDGNDTRKMTLPEIGHYIHAAPKDVVFRISDRELRNQREVRIGECSK